MATECPARARCAPRIEPIAPAPRIAISYLPAGIFFRLACFRMGLSRSRASTLRRSWCQFTFPARTTGGQLHLRNRHPDAADTVWHGLEESRHRAPGHERAAPGIS